LLCSNQEKFALNQRKIFSLEAKRERKVCIGIYR